MSMTTQFPCPSCGYTYTRTTSTSRSRSKTDVRRRRSCTKCSHGFSTYEILASDYAFLQATRNWIKESEKATVAVEETAQ